MFELSQYGKIVRYYTGKGLLSVETKESIECNFEVAQLSGGDIRMMLHRNDYFRGWDIGAARINFEGTTHDQRTLRTRGPVIVERNFIHEGQYKLHVFLNGDAKLQIGDINESIVSNNEKVKFAITNFAFIGTEAVSTNPNKKSLARLNLSVDGLEIAIDQLSDYDQRIGILQVSRGCDITCELAIPLNQYSLEQASEIASRICDLLSIARGRRINWIFYEVHNAKGEPVFVEHQPRITVPYAGFELIDKMPPENTRDYIQECYPRYTHLHAQYDLRTIANINSDIHSRGFVEARCLLIFSLLDHLFHKTSQESEKEKHYTSTKKRIKLLVEEFSVPITSDEIKNYKKFRNKLVHELRFLTGEAQADYIWLLHFYHRILLRLLGYTGYYINVTKSGLASGSQADKLTPKSQSS